MAGIGASLRWVLPALAVGAVACSGGGGGADPEAPPAAVIERSLVWTDAALLDDPDAVGLGRVMAAFSADGHGGETLAAWFDAFATTAHSQRYGPAALADAWRADYGADPSAWDLDLLPFKVTGVHNRIDLLERAAEPGGHCGELRVSMASTDPVQQPLHVLFLFRQPAGEGDRDGDGVVTCRATARRWAELSGYGADGAAWGEAARAILDEALLLERAVIAETVEQTISPWEWRQWSLDGTPSNPPLLQAVDIPRLNTPGAERDAFLSWVDANAAGLEARTVLIPDAWRPPSARVADGVPRETLDLTGVDPAVLAQFPDLRKNVEIVGCPVCHTADADFVQTRPDRTFSPFYEKELEARRVFLDALAAGENPVAPFGPLQPDPVLPE